MDRSANVTSIDAVRALRVALVKFEEGARDALTLLELEVRRGANWIEQDRRQYWPARVKQASEDLIAARTELERCQLKYGSEREASCYVQKKNYERAKRRLRYCEEQVRTVKKWTRTLRQELAEFDGQMAQMAQCLDADLPRARQVLSRMVGALEKYAGDRKAIDGGAVGASTNRAGDDNTAPGETDDNPTANGNS